MRRFDAAGPGKRANDVTNAGNGENENEAGAESLNARDDLADTRATHEVGKQKQAQKTEDDPKWSKSPAPALVFSQNIVRHHGSVPITSNNCTFHQLDRIYKIIQDCPN